jgi:hypothetical protein
MKRYLVVFEKTKIYLFISVLFITTLSTAGAFDFDFSLSENIDTAGHYQEINPVLSHDAENFSYILDMSLLNDGKYKPSQAEKFTYGFYYFVNNTGLLFDNGRFTAEVGRFEHADIVDSPYSLFISSNGLPSLLADFTYTDDRFFYTTRWLGLNRLSELYFADEEQTEQVDRGAQISTLGWKFGNLRLAYQEAAVYTGRFFDPEYFLSTLPGFFIQDILRAEGNPWDMDLNDNAIIGFFADYTLPELYAYGQILIDDINFNALVDPSGSQNPNKIAWSLGGRYHTSIGTFGAYHAGATKYTYGTYGGSSGGLPTDERYGYIYYPESVYYIDGAEKTIGYQDNYIGYKYGENNIAFQVDYSGRYWETDITGSLELVLSGSKSPANPWHEYWTWKDEADPGTKLLDDDVLETSLLFNAGGEKEYKNWLFSASLGLGYIWNKLQLEAVPTENQPLYNNHVKIFRPSGDSSAVFSLLLGVRYRWNVN